MKILSVIGTRPQVIKSFLLEQALREKHEVVTVDTGQHYYPELANPLFRMLDIPAPKWNLKIGSDTSPNQVAQMMSSIEEVMLEEKPDIVIVYGDTNSTFAGAYVASLLGFPVVHVEAGCRSYDKTQLEEISRVVMDHVSTLCLCPSKTQKLNLQREGIKDAIETGDILFDAMTHVRALAHSSIRLVFPRQTQSQYALMTLHRPENVDDDATLFRIFDAVQQIGYPVIFVTHPRLMERLQGEIVAGHCGPNVTLSTPLMYHDMLYLAERASVVITDSGGLQREAHWLGVPVVVIRRATEWPEIVAGMVSGILVPPVSNEIVSAVKAMWDKKPLTPWVYPAIPNVVKAIEERFS